MRGCRGSVTIHREGIRAKERAMTSDTRTEPGDLIVIEGRSVGTRKRTGEILEVLHTDQGEHYRVLWEDGHESVYYPPNDYNVRQAIEHHER
jgi:hypothetical protein